MTPAGRIASFGALPFVLLLLSLFASCVGDEESPTPVVEEQSTIEERATTPTETPVPEEEPVTKEGDITPTATAVPPVTSCPTDSVACEFAESILVRLQVAPALPGGVFELAQPVSAVCRVEGELLGMLPLCEGATGETVSGFSYGGKGPFRFVPQTQFQDLVEERLALSPFGFRLAAIGCAQESSDSPSSSCARWMAVAYIAETFQGDNIVVFLAQRNADGGTFGIYGLRFGTAATRAATFGGPVRMGHESVPIPRWYNFTRLAE